MTPSDADRSKARRLRKLEKAGTLDPSQRAWLATYRANQKQQPRAERGDRANDAGAPPSSSASSAPVHTTEVVNASGASSWASVPMLPPGDPEAAEPGSPPPLDGQGPPPPSGPTPIADEPQRAPMSEDALERGAQRFAGLVVALNMLGVKSALELADPDQLEAINGALDQHLGASVPKLTAGFLGIVHASAVNVARKHPLLCRSLPYEDEAVVVGSSAASIAAIYFRHVVKAKEQAEEEHAPPPRQAPAPSSPPKAKTPSNGATAPPPTQPLDFNAMFAKSMPEEDGA